MATERKTKKRGPNEGTIFKRADGRWCAQPSLGYVNGKRHRPTLYGQSYAEVREKLARVLAEAQGGVMPANKRVTLAAFLNQWLEDSVKPSRAPRTYASYGETVRLHLVPALGRIMLDKLTPQDVQRMMRGGTGRAFCSVGQLSPDRASYRPWAGGEVGHDRAQRRRARRTTQSRSL